jgi:hypothetical protein
MIPRMPKVAPTAEWFAKKLLEIAPAVSLWKTVDVEGVLVIRKPVNVSELPSL